MRAFWAKVAGSVARFSGDAAASVEDGMEFEFEMGVCVCEAWAARVDVGDAKGFARGMVLLPPPLENGLADAKGFGFGDGVDDVVDGFAPKREAPMLCCVCACG